MKPEELARQNIDRQLAQCGWIVQGHKSMNIHAGLGVAVREFPLKSGFADYLLYADAKAVGVVEAKPEGHGLKDKSLGDSEDLREPDVLAQEIVDDLQAALEQFTSVSTELSTTES